MVSLVKVLIAKPGNLSSIPGTHMVGENSQESSSGIYTYAHTHSNIKI